MAIIILHPEQFRHEVKQWGVKQESLHHVRAMRVGNNVHFRFYVPTGEVIQTIIPVDEANAGIFFDLAPIVTPGLWEIEDSVTKKLLKVINANNSTSADNTRNRNRD